MANVYLTESTMLSDERVQRIIQQDKRKERILQVFFKEDEPITYDQVSTIAAAGKKMSVDTTKFASRDDMLLYLGYQLGSSTKPSDVLYALFEDAGIMEFLKKHEILEIGVAEPEKRTGRPGRKKKRPTEGGQEPPAVEPETSVAAGATESKENVSMDINHNLAPFLEENDAKVFASIMGIRAKDIEYEGTEEALAAEIAECMQRVETEQANFKATLVETFGAEKGTKVYDLVNPNYVFLRGSLACVKKAN